MQLKTPSKLMNACCSISILRIASVLFFALCMCLFSGGSNAASMDLHVDTEGDVIACDVVLNQLPAPVVQALEEGTEIGFIWTINIAVERVHWFDRNVATVQVSHRVVPDLVSRSWVLVDETSGISLRVFDWNQVLSFLIHLQHFPVMDKSLLTSGKKYHATMTLQMREGEVVSKGFFSKLWDQWNQNHIAMASTGFTLP